ncbi:HAD-IA family hydrolase [Desulforhopalus sp. 52FAK]
MEHWNAEQDDVETFVEYVQSFAARSNQTEVNHPIVCVDYFDTIVTREVEPEYTKEIASQLLSQLLGGAVSGNELYKHRQHIEREIVETNCAATGELEFSLIDFSHRLFAFLKEQYPQLPLTSLENFTQDILNIEVAVELAVQQVCPRMLQALREMKNAGVQLVLASDFYVPESHFHRFIKHHGIQDLFVRLYVSIDYGQSKGSGKLYETIIRDFQCSPERILMIGDNEHADIKMAKKSGVQTILVSRPAQRQFYNNFRKELIGNRETLKKPYPQLKFKGEFAEMGSSFWLFCHRLFEDLTRKEISDVFFFSKEGEFLKKLFDRYQLDLYGQLRIQGHYLLASRKATFLASLGPLAEEDFSRLLDHYRDISIRDFLQSLNFTDDLVTTLCAQLSGDCDEVIIDLKKNDTLRELIDLPLFRKQYEEKRLEQRSNFTEYLDSFGVNYHDDGLCIVDVGWKGSIQDNIFYILEQHVDVQGYFIGLFNPTTLKKNNRKKGLLFENYPSETLFYKVYNNNRSLFEMMLGASHGSADCYLTPEQYKERSNSSDLVIQSRVEGKCGDILVMTLDLPLERELFETVIKNLQENIFSYFCKYNKSYVQSNCTLPDIEWFARNHAKMVFTPTRSMVDLFAELYHLENFGIFTFSNFKTDNAVTISVRLRNLYNIARNPSILGSGIWPPIIFRRLGLGPLQALDGLRRYYNEFSSFR